MLNDLWIDSEDIAVQDPEVLNCINAEEKRQAETLEMIASENIVSRAVLQALGTVLTNKYAEGYPGKRYYGGCECVDVMETIAIERAKKLFGADHANVQPHSGAQANTAVFFAAMKPGDTFLGMNLAHGGHLTHGSPVSMSGQYFNAVAYGVRQDDELIDYDDMAAKAREYKPKVIIGGSSSYPRQIDFARMAEIAKETGALLMVDMAHYSGLIAGNQYDSPVPYADFVTSTTHKTLRGPRSGMILCKAEHAAAVNKAVFPGIQGGPLMHVVAAKAVCFGEALQPGFANYAKRVRENADTLAETLKSNGVRLVSGGTDSHLLLIDLTSIGDVTGVVAQQKLEEAGITTNKNMIPYDQRKPMEASGIRIGTPAITTRGMGKDEMVKIGGWMAEVLRHVDDEKLIARVRSQVLELTAQYPLHRAEK